MASAAITIVENPATIESDGNAATITKSDTLRSMTGVLVNMHASVDTFLAISVTDTVGVPATSAAQAQLQCPLPAGESIPWLAHYKSIAHKTAGSASVLAWIPDRSYQR